MDKNFVLLYKHNKTPAIIAGVLCKEQIRLVLLSKLDPVDRVRIMISVDSTSKLSGRSYLRWRRILFTEVLERSSVYLSDVNSSSRCTICKIIN